MAGNRDEEQPIGIGAALAAQHQHFESQAGLQYTHHRYQDHPPYQQNPHPTPILIQSDGYTHPTLGQHRPLSPLHIPYVDSYVDNSLQAFNANATALLPADLDVVDPDDFYRNYRGIDTSAAPPERMELMASTLSPSRQTQNASLRSNGNGTTPRHPNVASTRAGLRASTRSVSAPVDDKVSSNSAKHRPIDHGQKPSVKDLKKRFDLHAVQSTGNTAARKAIARASTREAPSTRASKTASPTAGQTSYTTLRSSGYCNPDPGSASSSKRSTQRNRSVPSDQISNNPQSFASRILKPQASVGAYATESKSIVDLSQPNSPTSISAVPQSRGLLFGEILPADSDSRTVGYGIEGARARRTSESNLHKPGLHQRSLSHADAEPSSPSDWYRSITDSSPGAHRHVGPSDPSRPARRRNRSHSDLAGSKPLPQLRIPQVPRPEPPSEGTPTSRLPLAVRKLSNPADSPSPSSTRSNSPSTHKRPPAQERLPRHTIVTRSKTPTKVPTPKRVNQPGATTPNGNTRLNAYISAPPPKLSPQLRSSRPRRPVSSATTTSSRLKAVEREGARSPARLEVKTGTRLGEQDTGRRKISMGPIDFESRREQIKLSYTKSIRETEARAAARKAAEERKAKAESEAKGALAAERGREEQEREGLERREERLEQEAKEREQLENGRLDQEKQARDPGERQGLTKDDVPALSSADAPITEQPTLTITTSIIQAGQTVVLPEETTKAHDDSPTLGIPGSFPAQTAAEDEEAPASAISNTTEFDIEPQTEPPFPEIPIRVGVHVPSKADEGQQPTYSRSEYRSPFDEESLNDDGMSIKISLDTPSRADALYMDSALAGDRSHMRHVGSCSFNDNDEYEPKPLETPPSQTTVTIIGRNSDFQPLDRKKEEAPISTGTASEEGQEDAASRPEEPDVHHRLPCNEKTPLSDDKTTGVTGAEGCLVGPSVQESVARIRGSAGDASEPGNDSAIAEHDSPQDARCTADPATAMSVPQSLAIPRTTADVQNRISQTTVWTDYSIDSQNAYSIYGVLDSSLLQRDSSNRESTSVSEMGSRPQSIQYNRDSRDFPSSPELSPHGTYQDLELAFDRGHRLPEIDTGDSFAVEYITRKNSVAPASVPIIPDHAPPPPPDVASFPDATSSAPASEYFDDTRPSSYARTSKDDRSVFSMDRYCRESGDFSNSVSAPQSVDQASLNVSEEQSIHPVLDNQKSLTEGVDKTQDGETLSLPERKRLFTRLETIKELIDTEAFFIRDMNIVEEIYKGTAEACPKLDDTTIKLIFRNTDQIIAFHSSFLSELKEGVSSVYTPKTHRNMPRDGSTQSDSSSSQSAGSKTGGSHLNDENDRQTALGPIFIRNMEKMKSVHETFLKNSDHAAKRLIQIQEDPTVKVWLNECNEVARDLTKAWNLDSLLIKPMQRITKYPNLIIQLLHETPPDHPDRPLLESAKSSLENAIVEINKTKKNFELVGQIVGRKRKESSDMKVGFARAFGKRVDKLQAGSNREPEDAEYLKLHERFGDDYLRLQVVLRDVEFYARQVSEYVHKFLRYLSSMELVMRHQPSPHPEIESKWVRFSVSMRDVEKVALEQHLSQVRKQVIEPFELVIKSYANPSLAMKKRAKRRLDYEKSIQLTKNGKKVDKQLAEFVEQYEALNEALKKELPKLSSLTEKVGNICLGNLVNIQAQWFSIWKEKVKTVLEDPHVPEMTDIISTFQRDYKFQDEQLNSIGIVNPASGDRPSQSASPEDTTNRMRPRLTDLSIRDRGSSLNSDIAPSLPTPDFMRRQSSQVATSPSASATSIPSPHQYYHRDYYSGINGPRPGSGSPIGAEFPAGARSATAASVRPGTGHSYDSGALPRRSIDSSAQPRRSLNSARPSPYQSVESQRYSGLFQSALPLSDTPERQPRPSLASSRASSRDRNPINGYNVLWLAASLFEFNIETTKHEAGYPYLTYQAGEIFDVIAEKGELWLAKNQDDPNNLVGWLWSKHFAKLADD
ncbi:hypothetical protein DL766_008799 [Monosporascus sp. MC13-8B]|uniref:DH domain-containing protein n=1 Tax=Monosporascus cannonballus TaxID=155416 RepID=A0ABY0H799_9PEZI|nr:hypothetical protein DL762_004683 [Monosporascus cannonballus]RYO98734.1 hypothetical protein DL763_001995 [Monosporascus cannonballus]RYP17845.1 hypothetical protein DL766_008799 [Monosporascus sp. MC13-8B]